MTRERITMNSANTTASGNTKSVGRSNKSVARSMSSGNTLSMGHSASTGTRMTFKPRTLALANKQKILNLVESSCEYNHNGIVLPRDERNLVLQEKISYGLKNNTGDRKVPIFDIKHGVMDGGMQLVKRLPPINFPCCQSRKKDRSVSLTRNRSTSSSSCGRGYQLSSSLSMSFGISSSDSTASSWKKRLISSPHLKTPTPTSRFAIANGVDNSYFLRKKGGFDDTHLLLMGDLMNSHSSQRKDVPQEIFFDPFEKDNDSLSIDVGLQSGTDGSSSLQYLGEVNVCDSAQSLVQKGSLRKSKQSSDDDSKSHGAMSRKVSWSKSLESKSYGTLSQIGDRSNQGGHASQKVSRSNTGHSMPQSLEGDDSKSYGDTSQNVSRSKSHQSETKSNEALTRRLNRSRSRQSLPPRATWRSSSASMSQKSNQSVGDESKSFGPMSPREKTTRHVERKIEGGREFLGMSPPDSWSRNNSMSVQSIGDNRSKRIVSPADSLNAYQKDDEGRSKRLVPPADSWSQNGNQSFHKMAQKDNRSRGNRRMSLADSWDRNDRKSSQKMAQKDGSKGNQMSPADSWNRNDSGSFQTMSQADSWTREGSGSFQTMTERDEWSKSYLTTPRAESWSRQDSQSRSFQTASLKDEGSKSYQTISRNDTSWSECISSCSESNETPTVFEGEMRQSSEDNEEWYHLNNDGGYDQDEQYGDENEQYGDENEQYGDENEQYGDENGNYHEQNEKDIGKNRLMDVGAYEGYEDYEHDGLFDVDHLGVLRENNMRSHINHKAARKMREYSRTSQMNGGVAAHTNDGTRVTADGRPIIICPMPTPINKLVRGG